MIERENPKKLESPASCGFTEDKTDLELKTCEEREIKKTQRDLLV